MKNINLITLVGTGTCQLQINRSASSILVELPEFKFLFDIGHGTVQKLAQLNIKQNQLNHIVISHYHPDHLSDLIPFIHAGCWSWIDPRHENLHLYGPTGLTSKIDRLIHFFEPGEITRDTFAIKLHEHTGFGFDINQFQFTTAPLPPINNTGIKFVLGGQTVVFTGDSDYHEQLVHFLSGADLAIIDAGHPTDNQIIELAVKTQVPRIVLSHLYRETDEQQINHLAQKSGYKGHLIVGQDLMKFEFPR